MITLTKEQVERLAEGVPPWVVNPKWDAAMVIEKLAQAWLTSNKLVGLVVDNIIKQEGE